MRTTTAVTDGRAGLAYAGIPEEEGLTEAVYLCGLRQNSRDRSNLAFQNMGGPEEGAITMRTTVYSGEAGDTSARVLEDVRLEPGGFHQYSGLLGVLGVPAQGYVKVKRVEGRAPFYAYGVINDQANSDGSFVFPVTASSLEGRRGQTLPVMVETSAFTSELTVTNFSGEARTLQFSFVAGGVETPDRTADFTLMPMRLERGGAADPCRYRQPVTSTGGGRHRSLQGLLHGSGVCHGGRRRHERDRDRGQDGLSRWRRTVQRLLQRGARRCGFQRGCLDRCPAAERGEPQQPGPGQHRGGGRERQRLQPGDLRWGDGPVGYDHCHPADPCPGLASDQRDSGQLRPGDPAGVCPDPEGVGGRTPSWPTGWSTTAGPRESAAATEPTCRPRSSNLHYLAAELGFTPDKGSKPPFCGRGSPREGRDGRLDSLPAGIDWRERPPQGGRAAAHLLAHQLSLPEAAAGGPEGGRSLHFPPPHTAPRRTRRAGKPHRGGLTPER